MQQVTSIHVIRPYVVEVTFADGTLRRLDLEGLLYGEMFEPLKDPALFSQVSVDAELGTIVWPNGADLAPEFLYEGEPAATGE